MGPDREPGGGARGDAEGGGAGVRGVWWGGVCVGGLRCVAEEVEEKRLNRAHLRPIIMMMMIMI